MPLNIYAFVFNKDCISVNGWFDLVSFSAVVNTNCKYGGNKIINPLIWFFDLTGLVTAWLVGF